MPPTAPRPRRLRTRVPALGLGLLAAVLVTAGCGSSGDDGAANASAATSGTSSGLQTIAVGAVPSLDLGVLELGEQQGFFAKQGIKLKITNLDSGPTVVTGIVAGQFDVGYTAYAPPLLAVGSGAPLRVVSNTSTVADTGTNDGILVRRASGVTRWRDLAGKTIATNAPRSLLSLTVPAAVAKDGGDPSKIKIVPLPFNAIAKAVAAKQVDAGAELEPFLSAALAEHPELENLGDSTSEVLPKGSPSALFFTSAKTAAAKRTALAGFKRGLQASLEYANRHQADVKSAGAPLAGLDPAKAQKLPLSRYDSGLTASDLDPLVALMVQFKWLRSAPDLSAFVG
jgi:NitT/TauT family transport system substrate-binding protein